MLLAALLAVAVLLLLPGGLMLLARWSVRPFLSVAFWIASWWWLPRLGPGRGAFLKGALLAFALLGLARLLKPLRPRPLAAHPAGSLSLAKGLVWGGMALALVAPLTASWLPPPEAALDGLTARLLVARDGIPETCEPLLPGREFGLVPQGLASLAADVGLVSDAPAWPALRVAIGAAQALLLLAGFHIARRFVADVPAALGAIVLALSVSALGVLSAGAVLGAALALAAAPQVAGPARAPAVGAGVLLGASALCGGLAAPVVALGIGLASAMRRAGAGRGAALGRLGLAAATASLVVLPSLLHVSVASLLPSGLVGARVRSLERAPDADERAAMSWLESHTGPLDVVCADAPAALWIPALAGRGVVVEGRFEPVPSGSERALPARPCTLRYATGEQPEEGSVLFRSGAVTIAEIRNSRP